MNKNTLFQTVNDLVSIKSYPVTVLLVDDQEIISESVKIMLQDQENINYYYCKDPSDAIEICKKVKPTVILQDLVMPDMDGLSLLRYYLADPDIKNIPVIILSTNEDAETKAKAFKLGAADYIVKLPDSVELLARIYHHSAAYTRLLERNDAYEKLVESQNLLNADLVNAASYVTSLLPPSIKAGKIITDWRFIPSTQLGGDVFGYHYLDEDHFVLYLLDVCGHGVGAALLSITIANVIRSQSLANTDFKNPANLLDNLNHTFPMEKHNNMYFTIWYGVYNIKDSLLTYSSGGHPPALYYDEKSVNALFLKTEGVFIGAVPNATYANKEVKIKPSSKLFLYSDGVYELFNEKREVTTIDDFIDYLNDYVHLKDANLDYIIKRAKELQKGLDYFEDDFSIVQFNFSSNHIYD